MEQRRLKILQNRPVFGGIREDTLEFLLQQANIVSVAKEDYFFRENDPGSSMFVLEQGKVSIFKAWQGEDYLLSHLEEGDCFGEMALLDLYPRSASVRAEQDCTAIELSANTLYGLYEKDLQQFTIIQMNLGREISRRLRDTMEQMFQTMAQADAEQYGMNGFLI